MAGKSKVLEVMIEFLESEDWDYAYDEDRSIIETGATASGAGLKVVIFARKSDEQILVYCFAPVPAPEEFRAEVGEFLHRANFGMWAGNFEINYDNGQVRFNASADVEGGVLSREMAKNLVYGSVLTMGQHLVGLLGIIHGGYSVLEAMNTIEDD